MQTSGSRDGAEVGMSHAERLCARDRFGIGFEVSHIVGVTA